jgi:hypothetical protein
MSISQAVMGALIALAGSVVIAGVVPAVAAPLSDSSEPSLMFVRDVGRNVVIRPRSGFGTHGFAAGDRAFGGARAIRRVDQGRFYAGDWRRGYGRDWRGGGRGALAYGDGRYGYGDGRYGYGDGRYGERYRYRRYGYDHYHDGYGYSSPWWLGAGAAAAIIGSAIVHPAYGAYGGGHVEWCSQRYRSYDPGSDSYLGYDGLRHRCVGP